MQGVPGAVSRALALFAAVALASGCAGWRPVVLEREAIIRSELHAKEVRFQAVDGQHIMLVEEVHLPPAEQGLVGAYLRGLHEGKPARVMLAGIYALEAREVPFWRKDSFDDTVLVVSIVLVLGAMAVVTVWAVDEAPL